MLLHGLDCSIWLWYHMATNIWVVHFLVNRNKQGYQCFTSQIHSASLSHLEAFSKIQFLYLLYCPHSKPSYDKTEVVVGHQNVTKFIFRTSPTKTSPTKNPTKNQTNTRHLTKQHRMFQPQRIEQNNKTELSSCYSLDLQSAAVSCQHSSNPLQNLSINFR